MLNRNFLVQSIVCSVVLLATNQVYSDETPNMELNKFNKKETTSLEKPLNKKPSLSGLNLSLNIDKINLNTATPIRESKNNREQKNGIKRPKTHYGVGYEYRKSLREQEQSTERVMSAEKLQRPKRMKRSGRH